MKGRHRRVTIEPHRVPMHPSVNGAAHYKRVRDVGGSTSIPILPRSLSVLHSPSVPLPLPLTSPLWYQLPLHLNSSGNTRSLLHYTMARRRVSALTAARKRWGPLTKAKWPCGLCPRFMKPRVCKNPNSPNFGRVFCSVSLAMLYLCAQSLIHIPVPSPQPQR